jgi:hypothetical protein
VVGTAEAAPKLRMSRGARHGRELRSVATHVQGLPFDDYDDELPGDEAEASVGWWELVTLLVLVIAGAGLPVLGWLTGIAMLHASRAWTARDARIATLGPLPVVVAIGAWAGLGDPGVLLHLGPIAAILVFGGAVAGLLGSAYLTVRAFVLS